MDARLDAGFAKHDVAALASTGRWEDALSLAVKAIKEGTKDHRSLAIAGGIACRLGHFDLAIPYLRDALALHKNDFTTRANLAEALSLTGDTRGARSLCDVTSAKADKSLRLARLGAHLAQEDDDWDVAVHLLRYIVDIDSNDWMSWNNLGNALKETRDYVGAVTSLENAVRLAPDAPPIRINLGHALLCANHLSEAEFVLRTAAQEFAQDPEPLLVLANHYRETGKFDDCFAVIGDAARRAPQRADILADYGNIAAQRSEFDLAEQCFRNALKYDAAMTSAYVGLAGVLERVNREGELAELWECAREHYAEPEVLDFIDTLRLKRAGQFAQALDALERSGNVVKEAQVRKLRGDLLDRLGRTDEAFLAYSQMNESCLADPSAPRQRAERYRQAANHAAALLNTAWLKSWTPKPSQTKRASPVFLVGFPRSGTTLLDTILLGHPRVHVLEEEPFIGDLEQVAGGIEALPGLSDKKINELQERYWKLVIGVTTINDNSILIDKHPMHLNKVAVIHRLFPDARFIFALRHPLDVILSCYITNFNLNDAMANFLDLDDAAQLYAISMAHWCKAKAVFGLDAIEVRYENLIYQLPEEWQKLTTWLGIVDHSSVPQHRLTARLRGPVRTASYAQVTEGLYHHADGRWRGYEPHLTKIISFLQPWIEQLGYGASCQTSWNDEVR